MKTLLDFEGAGTLVVNTKKLVTDAIAAHNSDLNSHGGASAIDLDTLTDTFVAKVTGKDLSTDDFTNEYKAAIDGMSSTYAKKSDIAQVMRYKGAVANFAALPTDTSLIEIGDVYNVLNGGGVDENGIAIKSGDNVAWSGTGWDDLGAAMDVSSFMRFYIGTTPPTDTTVIWLEPI